MAVAVNVIAIYIVELWLVLLLLLMMVIMVMMVVVMVMVMMMMVRLVLAGSMVQFRCRVRAAKAAGARYHLPAADGQGGRRLLTLS